MPENSLTILVQGIKWFEGNSDLLQWLFARISHLVLSEVILSYHPKEFDSIADDMLLLVNFDAPPETPPRIL